MAPSKHMVTRSKTSTSKILGPKEPKSKISKIQPKPKSWRKSDSKLATILEKAPPEVPPSRHDTPLDATPPLEKSNALRTAKGRFKAAPKARPASSKISNLRTETTLTLIAIPLAHRVEATALVQDWRAENQHPRYPSNRQYAINGSKTVTQTIDEGPRAGEQEQVKIRLGQQGTHTFTGLGIDYALCYQRRTVAASESVRGDSGDAGKVEGMMVFLTVTKPPNIQNSSLKKAPYYALRNVPRVVVAPFHAGDEFFATLMAKSLANAVRLKVNVEERLVKVCQDWVDVAFLDPTLDDNSVVRMDTQIAVADEVEKVVRGDGKGQWAERCKAYNARLKGRC